MTILLHVHSSNRLTHSAKSSYIWPSDTFLISPLESPCLWHEACFVSVPFNSVCSLEFTVAALGGTSWMCCLFLHPLLPMASSPMSAVCSSPVWQTLSSIFLCEDAFCSLDCTLHVSVTLKIGWAGCNMHSVILSAQLFPGLTCKLRLIITDNLVRDTKSCSLQLLTSYQPVVLWWQSSVRFPCNVINSLISQCNVCLYTHIRGYLLPWLYRKGCGL